MTYLEEEEGTYLFFTEQTGSFRVTPLQLEGKRNFDAYNFLIARQEEYEGKIQVNIVGNNYLYYKSNDEDDDVLIYNWIFAKNSKIIYCSYTIDSEEDDTIIAERKEIFKIIDELNFD